MIYGLTTVKPSKEDDSEKEEEKKKEIGEKIVEET